MVVITRSYPIEVDATGYVLAIGVTPIPERSLVFLTINPSTFMTQGQFSDQCAFTTVDPYFYISIFGRYPGFWVEWIGIVR